jgi:hypothetical protein
MMAKEKKKIKVCVRIPLELLEKIETKANEEERSILGLIRMAIKETLEEEELGQGV